MMYPGEPVEVIYGAHPSGYRRSRSKSRGRDRDREEIYYTGPGKTVSSGQM